MDLTPSLLARPFPALPVIDGVTLRVARAGYKAWDRSDLTYVELAAGCAVAGVFTKSACASSQVEMGRAQVEHGRHAVARLVVQHHLVVQHAPQQHVHGRLLAGQRGLQPLVRG